MEMCPDLLQDPNSGLSVNESTAGAVVLDFDQTNLYREGDQSPNPDVTVGELREQGVTIRPNSLPDDASMLDVLREATDIIREDCGV